MRRVGDTRVREVNARVISATNRNLEREVQQQRFREDLYYRISVFPIHVPPLRERREDIPLLVSRFIQQSNEKLGKRVQGIAPQSLTLLLHYSWPGNVRELQNEIERAVVLTADDAAIAPDGLSEKVVMQRSLRVALPSETSSLKQARLIFEREYVAEVLRQNQGNAAKSAKILGISRQML
jgi:transcriptional regulator with PAS, ATPase and Fis domain